MKNRVCPIPLKRTPLQALENIYLDLRYGRKSLDDEKYSPFYEQGCFHTQSTEYEELKKVFNFFPLKDSDVIMDIGCGRGRVFNYLLSRKFKGQLYGVEIDPEIASFTEKRLKPYSNVTIFTGNALDYVREDVTIYYMFNPFDEKILVPFLQKIKETHDRVRVIYHYPQFIDTILDCPGWSGLEETYYIKSRGYELSCFFLEYDKYNYQYRKTELGVSGPADN